MKDKDYSKHPKSITEVRADKSESAADWTPRDVLINTLRDIDSGEIKPTDLVVVWRSPPDDPKEQTWLCNHIVSTNDTMGVVGLLHRTITRITQYSIG